MKTFFSCICIGKLPTASPEPALIGLMQANKLSTRRMQAYMLDPRGFSSSIAPFST